MKRLTMRKIRDALRLHASGMSTRKIAASLGVGQSTASEYVKRVQQAGLTWPLPSDMTDAALEALLFHPIGGPTRLVETQPDWPAIHRELRRPGLTLSLLWEEYRAVHPDGYGYSRFCELYRRWNGRLAPVMRQHHVAGERVFVDYAGTTLEVIDPATGEVHEAQLFVAALGASNLTYAEATWSQGLSDWVGAHSRAFAWFGGVPAQVVSDNLKSGVTRACFYEPAVNRTYADMAEHYGTAVVPARPRKPRDKAKVEVAVQIAERWIVARLRNQRFFSLSEMNAAIRGLLDRLNDRVTRHLGASRRDLFERIERAALRPLPAEPFVFSEWKQCTVWLNYHVEVDRHYYSAPHSLLREKVWVRFTARTVEIFHHGKRVAAHARTSANRQHTTIADHSVLDQVGIDVDAAVPEEEPEAVLPPEHVGQGLAEVGLARAPGGLSGEPGEEAVDQGPGPLLPDRAAQIGIVAADGVLDPVERGDAHQRLVHDGRTGLGLGRDQFSPAVRPAEGELQGLAALPGWLRQVAVAAIGVDLNGAVEPGEDFLGIVAAAPGTIVEHDAGRRRAVPAAVVAQHGPEVSGLRPAAPGIHNRGRGLVHVEPRAAGLQKRRHALDHRGDQRPGPAHPVGQHGAVDRHAVPGHDHGLTVQRHVLGMLGHRDLGEQRFGRPAALEQMRGGFRLKDAGPPLRAGVSGADRDDHLVARRDDVEPLGPVLADPDHVAAAARAGDGVRFDHALDPGQALGQRPGLSRLARGLAGRIGGAGRDLVLDRGDPRLGLGDGGLEIFQSQFQLRGVELLGSSARTSCGDTAGPGLPASRSAP